MAHLDRPPINIRRAAGTDLVHAHRIAASSFDLPYSYETLQAYRYRARGGFLVAELDSRIVGFVVATSPLFRFFGNRTGEIAVLAVDGSYRRQGMGSVLLTAALNLLRERGMRAARLHVETTNTVAISMYEQFGFRTECIVRQYYRNGRDACRMVKALD